MKQETWHKALSRDLQAEMADLQRSSYPLAGKFEISTQNWQIQAGKGLDKNGPFKTIQHRTAETGALFL